VFAIQGLAMWFVSAPVMVAASVGTRWTAVAVVGTVLWAVGIVFEAVGDAQLTAYRRLPKDQKPQVMETGLWRYTRHPNYFGDACVWWGLWLVGGLAAGPVPALITVLCPVAMTYFLVFATGARLLEKTMMQRPGYPEYAARTSMFFPLPPK
jgi:steroid 5-alpha reductase family enzyme